VKLAKIICDAFGGRAMEHAAGKRFYLRLEPGEIRLAVKDCAECGSAAIGDGGW